MQITNTLTLLELNSVVRAAVAENLPDSYWVRAETSDVRVNASSGHCYLEFVEKDEHSAMLVAKAKGNIWARNFAVIKAKFENETQQRFSSGLKVLVRVTVVFHELYGYSLNVIDIEPSYTLGDMLRRRREIIERLKKEGVFDLNRELPVPTLPQRIALITSPTAAGYEDFINQLNDNEYGFVFYIKLFPAVMQGDRTEESIIAALDVINKHVELFDVVVIIRGGGSASDLSCFDTYALAANCAQFPLPVITGIGHERDDSILDLVAHTRLKTPTAVAAFLIDSLCRPFNELCKLQTGVCDSVTAIVRTEKNRLQTLSVRMPDMITARLERRRNNLNTTVARLIALPQRVSASVKNCEALNERLRYATTNIFAARRQALKLHEQYFRMVAPENILRRGYALAYRNGMLIKRADALTIDDYLTLRFHDAQRNAVIVS
jgi:exodeoxyribonuclease VII large subunit